MSTSGLINQPVHRLQKDIPAAVCGPHPRHPGGRLPANFTLTFFESTFHITHIAKSYADLRPGDQTTSNPRGREHFGDRRQR